MKKWLKRAVLGTVLAFAISTLGLVIEWHQTRSAGVARRDAIAAALDAEDPNWRAADLCAARNATLPPPARNAGEIAVRAAGSFTEEYKKWAAGEKWRADLPSNRLPQQEDVEEAKRILAGVRPAVDLVRSARKIPPGGFALTFQEPNPLETKLQNDQDLREAARLLGADILVRACDNRADAALESALATLQCARAIGDEPTLVSQMVRIAIAAVAKKGTEQTLAWSEPKNDKTLAELQKAYAEELTEPRLKYALRGERAMSFMLLQKVDEGTVSLRDIGGSSKRSFLDWAADQTSIVTYKKYLPAQQATVIELFNETLAAEKLTGPPRRAAFNTIGSTLKKSPPRDYQNLLVRLIFPAFDKVATADDRCRAQMATAVAALACERYRLKTGRWPAALADVPKDILPTLPVDPYTDKALLFKTMPDGIVIYTTGPDLTDDGGATLGDKDVPGADIGFRLWNPDQRGLPPLPKPASGDKQPDVLGAPESSARP